MKSSHQSLLLLLWASTAMASRGVQVSTGPMPDGKRWVRTEGYLDSSVEAIQSTILDANFYPKFMPYVKESKVISRASIDSFTAYTLLDIPFAGKMDYVVNVKVSARWENSGFFANSWTETVIPEVPGVKRIRFSRGSWNVYKVGERCYVVYQLTVDSQALPDILFEVLQVDSAKSTLTAIEQEAQRRGPK